VNPRWQDLTLPERERAYSPSSCIGGNYQPFVAAYKSQSAAAVAACAALGAHRHALRYGPKPANRIDVWVPQSAQPAPGLLIFIHGGYWQELSAADSLFALSDCISQGLAFAAIDYTLAPHASVGEIADECRRAVACLAVNAQSLGFDATQMVVSGSSAGAHLAAMVSMAAMADASPAAIGKGARLHAAVLVSGIYDLAPLVGTSINTALGLDASSAGDVSPMTGSLTGFSNAVVCWGEIETAEFKRQSQDFAAALVHANSASPGFACDTLEVPTRNHFDVILDLANPATVLGQKTLALFNR
jgi:arylformamidase